MTVVDLPPAGARDPVLPPDEIAAAGLDKASSGNPAPERTQVRQPPPQILPVESNDNRETVEEIKVYARGPEPLEAGPAPTRYRKADPSFIAAPDRDRFYDVSYRRELRDMIDHVVEIEGPIYLDVMIDRIARAHGFQRSGEIVQRVVRGALGRLRFPSTKDGDREIIWPQNVTVGKKTPYRGAGGREHGDIPLPELAGLAELLRTQGLEDEEDLIRGIQEHFGLGRLAVSTRQRFEAAVAMATT